MKHETRQQFLATKTLNNLSLARTHTMKLYHTDLRVDFLINRKVYAVYLQQIEASSLRVKGNCNRYYGSNYT